MITWSRETPAHQRESFCVKLPAGARSVVCPCIAVMGLVPAARDRVDETTDGAAHDERRDHRGVSMPRRARPGRQLDRRWLAQAASACGVCWVPWVAMTGSQAWPVVMTACRCRRIAAAITVCAWVGVSLLCSLLVRCW